MEPSPDPFIHAILQAIGQTLEKKGVQAELNPRLIERPPDPEMGDYAFPCFALAKALKKAPAMIATELAADLKGEFRRVLDASSLLEDVVPAGPYLNFRVSAEAMARSTITEIQEGSYFRQFRQEAPPKVMVEYSQPNTHKGFHVGHMRNVALGDALVRILEYCGNEVIAANYIGDSGAHIAKCLWYYIHHRTEDPPQGGHEVKGEWLGALYTAATTKLQGADAATRKIWDAEIGEILREVEAGEGETTALWKETKNWSLEAFEEIYAWLGARFDHVFAESDMEAPGREVVTEGLEKGVFIHSEGAVGADLEADKLGFFLVLKSDGNTLYSTKDLALAEIKFRDFAVQKSIYVVGAEQTLHFRQVFKTLEKLGFPQAADSHHLAYGLVMLPEGKMSSRAGNVILFSQLREKLNDYIETNYMHAHQEEWSAEEISETTRRIAVAGIRYGMVKQDPTKSIIFDLDDWLVSEGDTGTYLCYAYTRIMSVIRQVSAEVAADFSLLTHENERNLVRELHDFNATVALAGENLRPNLVSGALFQIAKDFSRTYRTCSVKHAETPALGATRLALFSATGEVLKTGLNLLGITPPERM